MQSLQERLAAILREKEVAVRALEKVKAQEDLINDMIREANGEPKFKPRAPRSNVKQTILDLLRSAAESGLNAATAVETASRAGVFLERGTVSSLLSRLKNEGIVTYDGSVYRLLTVRPDPSLNVHPLRTSGAS